MVKSIKTKVLFILGGGGGGRQNTQNWNWDFSGTFIQENKSKCSKNVGHSC